MSDTPHTDDQAPRGLPRSRAEFRERLRDAWHFEDRITPPLVVGQELAHRAVVLILVAALTALGVALAAAPGVALFGRSVGGVKERFKEPIGSIELPDIAQRSVVLDRNGRTIATLAGEENRVFVPLRDVP